MSRSSLRMLALTTIILSSKKLFGVSCTGLSGGSRWASTTGLSPGKIVFIGTIIGPTRLSWSTLWQVVQFARNIFSPRSAAALSTRAPAGASSPLR